MFHAADITPDAIDALADEFAVLFAAAGVIDAYRGPAARVRTDGSSPSLSLQMGADALFVWSGKKYYMLPLQGCVPALTDLLVRRSVESVRLTEADTRNPRSIIIDVHDGTAYVWMGDRLLIASFDALTRALVRAGVLEVAR